MKLSPQQSAVIEFARKGKGNAFISAVAGAGKTSTLMELCKVLSGNGAFLAYNKKIADEIKDKLSRVSNPNARIFAGTFHSFGMNAVRYANKSIRVDDKAKFKALEAFMMTREFPNATAYARKVVSFLKQEAWNGKDSNVIRSLIEKHNLMESLEGGISEDSAVKIAAEAFEFHFRHYQTTNIIDFDDMLYLPIKLKLRMFQQDFVLVDESQDTNPARMELVRMMLKPTGRAFFVGDPAQAIYGFTGADANSIETIRQTFKTVELPLTVSFRCPKNVVSAAQNYVSHIESAATAKDGTVIQDHSKNLLKYVPNKADAILCRNTKPLMETAFFLIRNNIAAHVEGKNIGDGLLALVNRWKSVKTISTLRDKLLAYLDTQTKKLIEAEKEMAAEALKDRVETLFVIMDNCDSIDCIKTKIRDLFEDTNGESKSVTLSTVHKSKGREWNRVFILGQNILMPSPYAKKDWQLEQENNLIYVAYTRAMDTLIHLDLDAKTKK